MFSHTALWMDKNIIFSKSIVDLPKFIKILHHMVPEVLVLIQLSHCTASCSKHECFTCSLPIVYDLTNS